MEERCTPRRALRKTVVAPPAWFWVGWSFGYRRLTTVDGLDGMPIEFSCPCGRNLRVVDEIGGKRIRCPECSEPVAVPEVTRSSAPKQDGKKPRRRKASDSAKPSRKRAAAVPRRKSVRTENDTSRRQGRDEFDEAHCHWDDEVQETPPRKKKRKAKGATKADRAKILLIAVVLLLVGLPSSYLLNVGNIRWYSRTIGVVIDGPPMGLKEASVRVPRDWEMIGIHHGDRIIKVMWAPKSDSAKHEFHLTRIKDEQYSPGMRPVDSETGAIDFKDVLGEKDKIHVPTFGPADGRYTVETGSIGGVEFTRTSWEHKSQFSETIYNTSYIGYGNNVKYVLIGMHTGDFTGDQSTSQFDAIATTFRTDIDDAFIPDVCVSASDYDTINDIPRYSGILTPEERIQRSRLWDLYGREPTVDEIREALGEDAN